MLLKWVQSNRADSALIIYVLCTLLDCFQRNAPKSRDVQQSSQTCPLARHNGEELSNPTVLIAYVCTINMASWPLRASCVSRWQSTGFSLEKNQNCADACLFCDDLFCFSFDVFIARIFSSATSWYKIYSKYKVRYLVFESGGNGKHGKKKIHTELNFGQDISKVHKNRQKRRVQSWKYKGCQKSRRMNIAWPCRDNIEQEKEFKRRWLLSQYKWR